MSQKNSSATKYIKGQPQASLEILTWEEPLQIKINDKPYTITMRTPGQDNVLAAGLLFTEGIITTPDHILAMDELAAARGDFNWTINVVVEKEALKKRNIFSRSIASSASCGVCGKSELCDLVVPAKFNTAGKKLNVNLLPGMLREMQNLQSTFQATGGSHAASLFTLGGNVIVVHEDIGRHNAVDKVIGEVFLKRELQVADILFISGRVSYEIVAKCSQAKIPFLVAVSAPSSLAVDFCQKTGITLVAFCREDRATVYTHPENIQQSLCEADKILL